MASTEERMRMLMMINEGKISTAEGAWLNSVEIGQLMAIFNEEDSVLIEVFLECDL